ncbi:peptidylprolyl isomerase [Sphingomonas baiyangensis]|uniref:peptidylprolyl isomerase n=1 Tax=Sphingomonas baiyangensis TaxID=2572576 RepID=A0A4U1L255_9SPHN|nr:peptidylprolyl isomerase [Sphingomonas baiyangensis]TKD50086.1 peptidylprolyl isomerase [Sphingomonas baiyangensis]
MRRAFLRAAAALAAIVAMPALAQDAPPAPAAPPLPRVLIETSAGSMTVEADTVRAPVTAGNFLAYVDKKLLDGVVFYRVVKVQPEFGFVQFGPLDDVKKMLPPVKHEPTSQTGLSHTDGVLSVARFEPGSARGEFTIMVGDNSRGMDAGFVPDDKLGYAAFGRVVEGRDVLLRILDTPPDPAKTTQGAFKGQMPAAPVKIIRARRLAN